MALALTFFTIFSSNLHTDRAEMLEDVMNLLIRAGLFVVSCFVVPVVWIRALFRTRHQCPPIRNKLLLATATELAKRIRHREISSEEVVSTYVARCKEVNPLINAIVDECFDAAVQEARRVDRFIASGAKSREEMAQETPLLGLPITVKESIGVQGMSNAAGNKLMRTAKALNDADVVRRVKAAGGIPILVSNTPEMCMSWDTYNQVTGTTFNPYDTRRTSGGSSGGEAALLGSGASFLSLSSDIGGSARLPAMFCGVFGHKPSPGVVSSAGHMPDSDDKRWNSFFSIGPMVRYAEDLPLMLKTMRHPSGPQLKLDKKVPVRSIRFFRMADHCNSSVTSSLDPEIKNAMRRVFAHLESTHGIIVHEAELTDMKYSFRVASTILLGLEGVDSIFMKDTDPYVWKSVFVEFLKFICFLSPHSFTNIAYGMLKKLCDKLPKSYKDKIGRKNAALQRQFAEVLGNDGVLIYPTFISAAHYPGEIYHKISNVTYMMVFNALGLPVTQCPVGLNRNGLPIGLQIVANSNCDHLTIAVAQELEKAFGGWQEPSGEKLV